MTNTEKQSLIKNQENDETVQMNANQNQQPNEQLVNQSVKKYNPLKLSEDVSGLISVIQLGYNFKVVASHYHMVYFGSETPKYNFPLWLPQYPWTPMTYAMTFFFCISGFLHALQTAKLEAKQQTTKQYLIDFVKRICKRYWALYSTFFCILVCLIPLESAKNLTTICPFAYPGYFRNLLVIPQWFSMSLFTTELCFTFPIDLIVHFCHSKNKSNEFNMKMKLWITIALHSMVAAAFYTVLLVHWGVNPYLYISSSIKSSFGDSKYAGNFYPDGYFDWMSWVQYYCMGEILMCFKILLNFALVEGKLPLIDKLMQIFDGEQSNKIVTFKVLLNVLSVSCMYISLAPSLNRNENVADVTAFWNFAEGIWMTCVWMFPMVTGLCFYSRYFPKWWFVKFASEFKQLIYEMHLLYISKFRTKFYTVQDNTQSRWGYFLADVGVVCSVMFLAYLTYLIIQPIHELFSHIYDVKKDNKVDKMKLRKEILRFVPFGLLVVVSNLYFRFGYQ